MFKKTSISSGKDINSFPSLTNNSSSIEKIVSKSVDIFSNSSQSNAMVQTIENVIIYQKNIGNIHRGGDLVPFSSALGPLTRDIIPYSSGPGPRARAAVNHAHAAGGGLFAEGWIPDLQPKANQFRNNMRRAVNLNPNFEIAPRGDQGMPTRIDPVAPKEGFKGQNSKLSKGKGFDSNNILIVIVLQNKKLVPHNKEILQVPVFSKLPETVRNLLFITFNLW